MLMYRKFDPSRNQAEPTDESIPQYIRDNVAKGEKEAAEKKEVGYVVLVLICVLFLKVCIDKLRFI